MKRLSSVKAVLARVSPRRWLLVMLPITLCLAQLFSIGPDVQIAFVGLMSSDAPSLYATAYKEALAQFPSLWGWILRGFHWQFLSMGALVTLMSSQAKSFRSFIILAGISTAIAISVFDAISYFTEKESQNLVVSIGVNIIGGLVLVFIIGLFILISQRVHDFLKSFYPILSKATGLSLVGCSIAFSTAAYYVLYFFYQPVPVNVEVSATMPLNGVMGGEPITSDKAEKLNEGAETRTASLIPADLQGGNIRIMSPGSSPKIHWVPTGPTTTFNIKVDFYSDCAGEMDTSKLPKPSFTFERTGVREAGLTLGEKGGSIVLWGDAENKLTYDDKKPFTYWASSEKEGYSLSIFSAGGGILNNESQKEMATLISATLLKVGKDRSSQLIPRSINLMIDGTFFPVKFRPTARLGTNRRIICRNIPLELNAGVETQADTRAIFSAILVRVTPIPKSDPQVIHHFGTKLKISNTNGWIGLTGVPKSQLADSELGRSGSISFASGLENLTVDGEKIEINSDQSLFGVGDFRLSFTNDMRLRATATAKGIWLDQQRLNPTKWERLTIELQIFLITSLLGGVYWIRTLLSSLISRFRSSGHLGLDW